MGKVLIACEESQAVTKEMRALGIEAYSCDIEPCSGGYPEWHIQGDVTPLLEQEWDLIVAFPPCTYLTHAGIRHYSRRINSEEKVLVRERRCGAVFYAVCQCKMQPDCNRKPCRIHELIL